MQALRTPEDRFTDLPGFPFEPHYVTLPDPPGLRVAYVDEGDPAAPCVLLLHGEPTWSYLYRRMIPPLVAAGLRAVAVDLVGFGRSDKPAEPSDYTYARHVEWMRAALFDGLGLEDLTLLGQDWGGLVGLRLVAEHPDRFARVVAANTGLPTGEQRMPEAWLRFRDFVATADELPVGMLVAGGCRTPMPDEVRAAYEAPFPDGRYAAGARAFPGLVPTSPDDEGAVANRAAWQSLATFDRPFLCAFSDGDPITGGADRPFRERIPGARGRAHPVVTGAGHFLQEDAGERLAEIVVDFVRST